MSKEHSIIVVNLQESFLIMTQLLCGSLTKLIYSSQVFFVCDTSEVNTCLFKFKQEFTDD